MEARIIAMARSTPPEGYTRWTIKLITEQAKVKLESNAVYTEYVRLSCGKI